MNNLTVETEDSLANLLELAANNDVEAFKQIINHDFSLIDEVGLWYGRQKGSKQMVLLHRTPLMIASTYGSVDVVKLIISFSSADLKKSCGVDKTTALHCAASGGSLNVIDIVKLLLEAGADPNIVDANGDYPIDVIVVPPKLETIKNSLEKLLSTNVSTGTRNLRVSISTSNSCNSPPSSPEKGSPSSPLDSNSSPDNAQINDVIRKEYPVDPSLPDLKNGIYSTDEFRMFSFKVRPCSRAYSHDWTECPFVHPGENARRRDPRKFHYSCVPCPDFRKGACRRSDMCEYAHGVFESWLHPAQYRTRICKDGISCNRRVCFFAHTQEELRPLYVSTGSAVPSPRSGSTNVMDFASLLSNSPLSPLSPSANGMSNIWAQQNVPTLLLPGNNNNFQSSRLRSSLNARDIQADDEQKLLNELSRLNNMTLNHSNLEDLFCAESFSPRYSEPGLNSAAFSPTHKSAIFNQIQQQKNMLSPINTSYSPKSPINSPMSARISMLRENQNLNFRSLSSRDLGTRGDSWSNWGSPSGTADWSVNGDEFGKLRRSSSFELKNHDVEEPDLGWVHSLVKETPQEIEGINKMGDGAGSSGEGSSTNQQMDDIDQSVLGAWLEQMQLDKLMP